MKKEKITKQLNKKVDEYLDWDREDLVEALCCYFNLVETLNDNSDLIPEKLMDLINDNMYAHFEP